MSWGESFLCPFAVAYGEVPSASSAVECGRVRISDSSTAERRRIRISASLAVEGSGVIIRALSQGKLAHVVVPRPVVLAVYEDGDSEELFLDQALSAILPASYKHPAAIADSTCGMTWPPPVSDRRLVLDSARVRKTPRSALLAAAQKRALEELQRKRETTQRRRHERKEAAAAARREVEAARQAAKARRAAAVKRKRRAHAAATKRRREARAAAARAAAAKAAKKRKRRHRTANPKPLILARDGDLALRVNHALYNSNGLREDECGSASTELAEGGANAVAWRPSQFGWDAEASRSGLEGGSSRTSEKQEDRAGDAAWAAAPAPSCPS